MPKSLKDLLEEVQEEKELLEAKPDIEEEDEDLDDEEDTDDDAEPEKKKDEKISDHAPDGKGHYTADDLREIIDYVRDLLEKEKEEDGDDEAETPDGDKKKKKEEDVGEIGLDLIYEYADLLPETVINQIVDDLKDMFEIEDTMLESIIAEGSAFFMKSKKGPAAVAAARKMRQYYRKNKARILARNKKWRNSLIGKKMAELHRKIFSGMGKIKGKRVVHIGI